MAGNLLERVAGYPERFRVLEFRARNSGKCFVARTPCPRRLATTYVEMQFSGAEEMSAGLP